MLLLSLFSALSKLIFGGKLMKQFKRRQKMVATLVAATTLLGAKTAPPTFAMSSGLNKVVIKEKSGMPNWGKWLIGGGALAAIAAAGVLWWKLKAKDNDLKDPGKLENPQDDVIEKIINENIVDENKIQKSININKEIPDISTQNINIPNDEKKEKKKINFDDAIKDYLELAEYIAIFKNVNEVKKSFLCFVNGGGKYVGKFDIDNEIIKNSFGLLQKLWDNESVIENLNISQNPEHKFWVVKSDINKSGYTFKIGKSGDSLYLFNGSIGIILDVSKDKHLVQERDKRINLLGAEDGEKFFNRINDIVKDYQTKLFSTNNLLKFKLYGLTGSEEHGPEDIGKTVNGTVISQNGFSEGRNEVIRNTIYKLIDYKITAIEFKRTNDGKGIEWTTNGNKFKVSIDGNILTLEADGGKKWLKYKI